MDEEIITKWVKATSEAIVEFYEAIKEALAPVVKAVYTTIKNFMVTYEKTLSLCPEIKKCYGIYNRTKSGRIKKKQLTRINKLSRRIIYGKNK